MPRETHLAAFVSHPAPREEMSDEFRSTFRVVLAIQALTTLAATGVFGWSQGGDYALAAFYGGVCSLVASVWLAWRVQKLAARDDAQINFLSLVAGMLPRFLFVCAALVSGVVLFELHVVPLALSFGLGYGAYAAGFRLTTVAQGRT